MPVNATIPLTQDFLETAASYPFLTELIQHPTDGYLYGCYHSSALFGSAIRVKADNFADITTVDFANDGQHANPVDMVYVPSTDRFYVLFRNGDANRCVISAVTPSTLARVDFFNFEDIQVGAGSITADATNLYVVTFPTTPSYLVIIPIAAPGTFAEPTPLTGFSQAHCVRQFGGKLFAQGMTPPTTGWVMRLTTAGVVEETATFTGEEGEFPVDEIGESASHIWVGNRDLSGEIRKYSKTSFINPEVILTAQLSKCTCVKTVGNFIWAAFENGRGVRINPSVVADRRIYTLNAGEGYHSEFTGGNEFVYTYNYFEGKIARYHIPADTTTAALKFGSTGYDDGRAIAVDSFGNYFVTGLFTGTVAFGGTSLTSAGSGRATDIVVMKLNSSGTVLWAVPILGSCSATTCNSKNVKSIAVDESSPTKDVYVAGFFDGTIDCSGESHTSLGNNDIFLAKYNGATGALIWSRRYGSTGNDQCVGVVVDSAGNIFITGMIGPDVNFGGGVLSNPTSTIFVAKFNSSGTHLASQVAGSFGTVTPGGIAIDSANNIWITGSFLVYIDFTPFGGGQENATSEFATCFLAKLNSSLGFLFSRRFGNTQSCNAFAVACDSANNVVVTGQVRGAVDYSDGEGGGNVGSGHFHSYIAKYNASNVYQWAIGLGYSGGGTSIGLAIKTIPVTNDIAVGGYFTFGVNFGSDAVPVNRTSRGGTDAFIARYSAAAGVNQSVVTYGSTGGDFLFGLSTLPAPATGVAATGGFVGQFFKDAETTPLLTSSGSGDNWVLLNT